ncbi:MAG: DMT family transporter, partial [Alphaproteobacteria bacterium]
MATSETNEAPAGAALDSRSGRLRGMGLMCVALAMFALLDGSAKYLGAELPTIQIVWARYLIGFLVTFIFVSPRRLWRLGKSRNIKLQLFRSAMLLGATMFNFIAVRYLQLSLTATIFFVTPLLVAALAVPILGERVGVRRWAAIFVGFSGVVFVTQPWLGDVHWAIGLAVLATTCYAL